MKQLLAVLVLAPWLSPGDSADKTNIVYILCDELGYGDVKCLGGARGKIATANMDRLAAQGMVFTEAHSSSAVCTPTRYGILTGRYNWRSRLRKGVLSGYSKPLMDKNRLTVPALLGRNGYDILLGKEGRDRERVLRSFKNDCFVREKRFRPDEDGVLYDIQVTSDRERYSEACVPKKDFSSDRQRLGAILDQLKSIEPESKPAGKSNGKRSKVKSKGPTAKGRQK